MERTPLGDTGLQVSRLGAGLSWIERTSPDDVEAAGRVLNAALDGGINFLDTAACYGISEEVVGRTVSHRRREFVLATKCGHVTAGYVGQPWTATTVKDSIERSLRRMKTDYLDLVQLHSFDLATIKRGDATQALLDAKREGKARFIGSSGDNAAARWAVDSGAFDTLQTSFSLVDQQARSGLLAAAKAKGMGVIIKRPIGNATWATEVSHRPYTDEYLRRARLMRETGPVPGAPDDPIELAMGFVFAHPEVDTAILGTGNPEHMRANIDLVDQGLSISSETIEELRRRFDLTQDNWAQLT